jgi:hypothetical protein
MDFEKMGEKPGVTLYTLRNPVHCAMVMIKIPTAIRIHATVNSMTFVFTVKGA